MPAERAGYTVVMFLVDISPSMGTTRTVELPQGPNGKECTTEMTNLEWSLQFVKLKIQEMIFNGRKTDQCGVIVFGSEDTDNIINEKSGGYENVSEYIPIGQPNAGTLSKIDALKPSTVSGDRTFYSRCGVSRMRNRPTYASTRSPMLPNFGQLEADLKLPVERQFTQAGQFETQVGALTMPIDALIVGIETQHDYLSSKKTWTRKIVLITDGENPIEIEDWEATVKKMDVLDIGLTVIGVDFDDEELPYVEEDKSEVKRANETFYATLTSTLISGVLGSCALALRETARPDIKQTKSTLTGTVLRLGDTETREAEALEVLVKSSKCTALSRPKSWKKFAVRTDDPVEEDMGDEEVDGEGGKKVAYAQLKMRTEYYVDRSEDNGDDEDEDVKMEVDEDEDEEKKAKDENLEKVEKEQLVRGFKYGTTYAPCPDGQFPRLNTKKGIDICGFFQAKNFRRELSLGEIQYIWADPGQPQQQVALSSIVHAMFEKNVMAIGRWVTKDGMDPKMGVLAPSVFEKVDCLLWAQMPFADDVRKYTFASLDNLISKKGEIITTHPYIPTEEQLEAMDNFVDSMDLMEAGEKDDEGNRLPWFDTRLSYNPAIHRTKQALFHCAVVSDISANPLPPPHPELLKYFEPPRRVLKRAREAIDECKAAFKVKEVPKKVARTRKDGHVHAQADDEEMLLLDKKSPPKGTQSSPVQITHAKVSPFKAANAGSDTEDDDDSGQMLLDKPTETNKRNQPLPTPARSMSPQFDPGRASGRIIGTTYPLADFQKNIAQGDVVSKAVEDLAFVIKEIVMRPFSSRRSAELLECMTVLRDISLKEDEIDAWNSFIEDLRETCTSEPGNREFWTQVQEIGRSIGLISKNEADKYGGTSTISESKAEEFVNT